MATSNAELGSRARALTRAADRGALATAMAGDGSPYASLVMVACAHDASPLLLISTLAEHTRNIMADDRVGLLIDGTGGLENPLTGPRVTLTGRIAATDAPDLLARYVARHPDAARYAGFADFALYRMSVERAHMVAGFGAIHWIERDDCRFDTAGAAALADAEPDIVAHMNGDHADAVQLYANALLGLGGDGWRMTGLDPEGCDLRRSGAVARLGFRRPLATAEQARAELVALVRKARKSTAAAR
jgi:putative heme iron utilization protein